MVYFKSIRLLSKRNFSASPRSSKKIGIIGGGVSALSLAFHLKKLINPQNITIFESTAKTGGLCNHRLIGKNKNFFFNKGPYSLMQNSHLTQMIDTLGLNNEMIEVSSNKSYTMKRDSSFDTPKSPTFLKNMVDVISDDCSEDNSIASFCKMSGLTDEQTDTLNTLLAGIFAGDPNCLSARYCINYCIKTLKERKTKLFSFKTGVSRLTDKLYENLKSEGVNVLLNAKVAKLNSFGKGEGIALSTAGDSPQNFAFDTLVSCVSAGDFLSVLENSSETRRLEPLMGVLREFESAPIVTTNIGIAKKVGLKPDADCIGVFRVASKENAIIGISYNSRSYPAHDMTTPQTRLTVYSGGFAQRERFANGLPGDFEREVVDFVKKNILESEEVDIDAIETSIKHFPQYNVGHSGRVARLRREARKLDPGLRMEGWSMGGTGVKGCIQKSVECSEELMREFEK